MNHVPVGWSRRQWGDIAVLRYGKALHDYRSTPHGVPVYGTNGFVGRTSNPALCPHAGVIVGRKGAYRGIRYSPVPFFVIDTAFWLQPLQSMDLRWAYYQLLIQDINAMDSGSAIPSTSRPDFYALSVLLPPLEEQRGIAATLGALDDKIESNRRLDELCLAIAVETYRSASAESSRWLPLGQAGKWLSGGTPSTEEPTFWSGEFPWISAASLKSFHIAVSERRLTSAGLQQATNVVPAGTVLMVVRGMSLKSELRMGVAQRPVAFGQDCKAIIPTAVPSGLLATALYSARGDILALVDEAGHGTGRLQWDLLSAFPIAIPDEERLVPLLDALLARGAAAAAESRKLAELRDALLPALLSGRIRVPEANEAVDEALA